MCKCYLLQLHTPLLRSTYFTTYVLTYDVQTIKRVRRVNPSMDNSGRCLQHPGSEEIVACSTQINRQAGTRTLDPPVISLLLPTRTFLDVPQGDVDVFMSAVVVVVVVTVYITV